MHALLFSLVNAGVVIATPQETVGSLCRRLCSKGEVGQHVRKGSIDNVTVDLI